MADHLTIGHQAKIGAKAGLMKDVADGCTVLGSPAAPLKQKMQEFASIARLPEMRQQLRQLTGRLDELQGLLQEMQAAPSSHESTSREAA